MVTEEDEKIVDEVLTPYWTGKDYATAFAMALPEETRFMMYGPDPKNTVLWTAVVMGTSTMRHSQNWTPDFNKILTRGVKGIREEAQAKLDALTGPRDIVHKKPFLEAVIMTCDAMTIWSRRYAKLATETGGEGEGRPTKEGLSEDRRGVRMGARKSGAHLPRGAAGRSGGARCSTASSSPRAPWARAGGTSIFLPFYRNDIAEGRITEESAMELLHCVWLNMQQCVEIKLNPVAAAGTEGFSKFEDICLGGQTPDGKDATNELTYLILESTRALPITRPSLACAFTPIRPTSLLHYVAEVDQGRQGIPEAAQRRDGSSPSTSPTAPRCKEALDWNISGCWRTA